MRQLPDHRILQSFVTVARVGNVTRAAQALNLTQPAISQHLKRLSEETGLKLFRRTPAGLELTREGIVLAAKAEQALLSLVDFGETAQHLTGRVRGKLRIGTIIDPDFVRLGAFLVALVKVAPGLEPELVHGMSGDVIRRIVTGEVDAGYYLGDPNASGSSFDPEASRADDMFHCRELTSVTYSVIAPPGWEGRVLGKGWRELAALPWIATPEASAHHRALKEIFDDLGVRQNRVALVDQESSMLAMVRSGVGLSLCRDAVALSVKGTHAIAIADKVEVSTSLTFVTLACSRENPKIDCAFKVMEGLWHDGRTSAKAG